MPERTTNDVSAVADPNTPVSAYDSYPPMSGWMLIGGTSVSTPIVSAAMALASQYTRSFEGARALYLDALAGGGFNDITSGIDGTCGSYLCEAAAGYDGPSGLGSLRGAPEVPAPTPVTGTASAIQQSTATLGATVNSHGASVQECSFEYGTTPAYGTSVPCSSLPSASTTPVSVSAPVSGLAAGTAYHFRIAVGYPGGPARGADATFQTSGQAPAVTTGEASAVTRSSVIVHGQVNPHGQPVGECEFEYGATSAYGHVAACTPAPGAGSSPVTVSAALGGFAAGDTIHYRLAASNENGTSYGVDAAVTLLPALPVVATGPPSAVTQSSANLTGTVDTKGAALTACAFEFNTSETYVPCSSTPAAMQGPVAVSAKVTGLARAQTSATGYSPRTPAERATARSRNSSRSPPRSPRSRLRHHGRARKQAPTPCCPAGRCSCAPTGASA